MKQYQNETHSAAHLLLFEFSRKQISINNLNKTTTTKTTKSNATLAKKRKESKIFASLPILEMNIEIRKSPQNPHQDACRRQKLFWSLLRTSLANECNRLRIRGYEFMNEALKELN